MPENTLNAIDELVALVATLRSPGGCDWDRAQSWKSLRPYVLEEAYEVVEAIDGNQPAEVCSELGDALFQVVLLSQIAADEGLFTIEDVARGITTKMTERHPHVFAGEAPPVRGDWERRKARKRTGSAVDGVPAALPALMRAQRISDKAAGVGFDWPSVDGVRRKVDEELKELDDALESGDEAHISEEFGDLLFALVNLGRHLPMGAEMALREATTKFERRFRALEDQLRREGIRPVDATPDQFEAAWQLVKRTC